MSLSLLFPDSEVASVVAEPDGVRIKLSAAHARQEPESSKSTPLEGYARGVSLLVHGANTQPELGSLLGRLSSGRLHLAGSWAASVPLPFAVGSEVRLELNFANQSQLVLSGRGFSCGFDGEPNFSESLFC